MEPTDLPLLQSWRDGAFGLFSDLLGDVAREEQRLREMRERELRDAACSIERSEGGEGVLRSLVEADGAAHGLPPSLILPESRSPQQMRPGRTGKPSPPQPRRDRHASGGRAEAAAAGSEQLQQDLYDQLMLSVRPPTWARQLEEIRIAENNLGLEAQRYRKVAKALFQRFSSKPASQFSVEEILGENMGEEDSRLVDAASRHAALEHVTIDAFAFMRRHCKHLEEAYGFVPPRAGEATRELPSRVYATRKVGGLHDSIDAHKLTGSNGASLLSYGSSPPRHFGLASIGEAAATGGGSDGRGDDGAAAADPRAAVNAASGGGLRAALGLTHRGSCDGMIELERQRALLRDHRPGQYERSTLLPPLATDPVPGGAATCTALSTEGGSRPCRGSTGPRATAATSTTVPTAVAANAVGVVRPQRVPRTRATPLIECSVKGPVLEVTSLVNEATSSVFKLWNRDSRSLRIRLGTPAPHDWVRVRPRRSDGREDVDQLVVPGGAIEFDVIFTPQSLQTSLVTTELTVGYTREVNERKAAAKKSGGVGARFHRTLGFDDDGPEACGTTWSFFHLQLRCKVTPPQLLLLLAADEVPAVATAVVPTGGRVTPGAADAVQRPLAASAPARLLAPPAPSQCRAGKSKRPVSEAVSVTSVTEANPLLPKDAFSPSSHQVPELLDFRAISAFSAKTITVALRNTGSSAIVRLSSSQSALFTVSPEWVVLVSSVDAEDVAAFLPAACLPTDRVAVALEGAQPLAPVPVNITFAPGHHTGRVGGVLDVQLFDVAAVPGCVGTEGSKPLGKSRLRPASHVAEPPKPLARLLSTLAVDTRDVSAVEAIFVDLVKSGAPPLERIEVPLQGESVVPDVAIVELNGVPLYGEPHVDAGGGGADVGVSAMVLPRGPYRMSVPHAVLDDVVPACPSTLSFTVCNRSPLELPYVLTCGIARPTQHDSAEGAVTRTMGSSSSSDNESDSDSEADDSDESTSNCSSACDSTSTGSSDSHDGDGVLTVTAATAASQGESGGGEAPWSIHPSTSGVLAACATATFTLTFTPSEKAYFRGVVHLYLMALPDPNEELGSVTRPTPARGTLPADAGDERASQVHQFFSRQKLVPSLPLHVRDSPSAVFDPFVAFPQQMASLAMAGDPGSGADSSGMMRMQSSGDVYACGFRFFAEPLEIVVTVAPNVVEEPIQCLTHCTHRSSILLSTNSPQPVPFTMEALEPREAGAVTVAFEPPTGAIQPGESVEVRVMYRFSRPGRHHIRAVCRVPSLAEAQWPTLDIVATAVSPSLHLGSHMLDFGLIERGHSCTLLLHVSNPNPAPVTFTCVEANALEREPPLPSPTAAGAGVVAESMDGEGESRLRKFTFTPPTCTLLPNTAADITVVRHGVVVDAEDDGRGGTVGANGLAQYQHCYHETFFIAVAGGQMHAVETYAAVQSPHVSINTTVVHFSTAPRDIWRDVDVLLSNHSAFDVLLECVPIDLPSTVHADLPPRMELHAGCKSVPFRFKVRFDCVGSALATFAIVSPRLSQQNLDQLVFQVACANVEQPKVAAVLVVPANGDGDAPDEFHLREEGEEEEGKGAAVVAAAATEVGHGLLPLRKFTATLPESSPVCVMRFDICLTNLSGCRVAFDCCAGMYQAIVPIDDGWPGPGRQLLQQDFTGTVTSSGVAHTGRAIAIGLVPRSLSPTRQPVDTERWDHTSAVSVVSTAATGRSRGNGSKSVREVLPVLASGESLPYVGAATRGGASQPDSPRLAVGDEFCVLLADGRGCATHFPASSDTSLEPNGTTSVAAVMLVNLPGSYTERVSVTHAGEDAPITLPLRLRVTGKPLLLDPLTAGLSIRNGKNVLMMPSTVAGQGSSWRTVRITNRIPRDVEVSVEVHLGHSTFAVAAVDATVPASAVTLRLVPLTASDAACSDATHSTVMATPHRFFLEALATKEVLVEWTPDPAIVAAANEVTWRGSIIITSTIAESKFNDIFFIDEFYYAHRERYPADRWVQPKSLVHSGASSCAMAAGVAGVARLPMQHPIVSRPGVVRRNVLLEATPTERAVLDLVRKRCAPSVEGLPHAEDARRSASDDGDAFRQRQGNLVTVILASSRSGRSDGGRDHSRKSPCRRLDVVSESDASGTEDDDDESRSDGSLSGQGEGDRDDEDDHDMQGALGMLRMQSSKTAETLMAEEEEREELRAFVARRREEERSRGPTYFIPLEVELRAKCCRARLDVEPASSLRFFIFDRSFGAQGGRCGGGAPAAAGRLTPSQRLLPPPPPPPPPAAASLNQTRRTVRLTNPTPSTLHFSFTVDGPFAVTHIERIPELGAEATAAKAPARPPRLTTGAGASTQRTQRGVTASGDVLVAAGSGSAHAASTSTLVATTTTTTPITHPMTLYDHDVDAGGDGLVGADPALPLVSLCSRESVVVTIDVVPTLFRTPEYHAAVHKAEEASLTTTLATLSIATAAAGAPHLKTVLSGSLVVHFASHARRGAAAAAAHVPAGTTSPGSPPGAAAITATAPPQPPTTIPSQSISLAVEIEQPCVECFPSTLRFAPSRQPVPQPRMPALRIFDGRPELSLRQVVQLRNHGRCAVPFRFVPHKRAVVGDGCASSPPDHGSRGGGAQWTLSHVAATDAPRCATVGASGRDVFICSTPHGGGGGGAAGGDGGEGVYSLKRRVAEVTNMKPACPTVVDDPASFTVTPMEGWLPAASRGGVPGVIDVAVEFHASSNLHYETRFDIQISDGGADHEGGGARDPGASTAAQLLLLGVSRETEV